MLNIKLQSKFLKKFQGNSFKTLFKKKFSCEETVTHFRIYNFIPRTHTYSIYQPLR